jgi:hypothetical protein
MKTLSIGDFKREGAVGSFQHYFSHIREDGKEICLEACQEGYCVAVYDKKGGDIVGEKECTKMGAKIEAGMIGGPFSMATGDALQKAVNIASVMNKIL